MPPADWRLPGDLFRAGRRAGSRRGLRGSDAVYAAVALRFGSTLVALDREQRQRVALVISSCLPAEAPEDAGS